MVASKREPTALGVTLGRAGLAGLAMGAIPVASAALVLRGSTGLAGGAAGLIATGLVSLLTGLWAGSPSDEEAEVPYPDRWVSAAVAVAVAGAFASFLTLYQGLGGGAVERVVSLLALLAAPLYAIGMLLPALLVWGERFDEEEAPEGWGALGGVVAGTLGGMTVGVVAAGVLLLTWFGAGPLLLGLSVLLLVPVFLPEPPRVSSNERVLVEVTTPLSQLRVTEVVFPGERQPERRLYLGDEQESGELVRSGAPTLAYVAAAESWLTRSTPRGSAYLFLGGGAYTLPRRIAEHDGGARVAVVELDPEVTRLAHQYFGLRRDHAIQEVHGDARAYLERHEERWDRIYLDVFGGSETIPYHLTTVEAFATARRRLRAGGALGINLIGSVDGIEAGRVWSVIRSLAEAFPRIALFSHLGPDYPDRQNLLAVAAETPEALPSAAGLFEPWPLESFPAGEGRLLRDLEPPPGERGGG